MSSLVHEIFDARATALLPPTSQLERLCSGAIWSEGPVWLERQASLLWSDIPNNRMLRWRPGDGMDVWRDGVAFTNGHCLDRSGDLLHCSHGLRAIVKTPRRAGLILAETPDEILVDRFEDRRLNSPNDIVCHSDGSLWFTDPPYGILSDREGFKAVQEQAHCAVYRFDMVTRALVAVATSLLHPNGLAFSPDESVLYVSDTSAVLFGDDGFHHIVAFDVIANTLCNRRVFATISPGLPDGFRVDTQGRLWVSSADSVQVYAPDGALLAKIFVPEKVGNLTFGGPRQDVLYIAASSSIYALGVNARGIGPR